MCRTVVAIACSGKSNSRDPFSSKHWHKNRACDADGRNPLVEPLSAAGPLQHNAETCKLERGSGRAHGRATLGPSKSGTFQTPRA